jgi:hypothetical protein
MTAAEPALRVVSFGDLEGQVWAAVFDAGRTTVLAGIGDGRPSAGPAAISASDTGEWKLSGDWLQVSVTPPLASGGNSELCHAHGRLALDGTEVEVDCPATRSYARDLERRDVDSVRGLWGWFEDEQALAVLAVRPRGRAPQEAERLTATLFDPEGPLSVEEPRLSTTYDSDGRPTRAGLELWIGEGEEQYPRRAAAEAAGPGASLDADGVTVQARPLRCHSRGLDGPGVYLLARF